MNRITPERVSQPNRLLSTLLFASALVLGTAHGAIAQSSSTAPNSVHVAMSPTAGIEVDYTPETGAGTYFYPGNHSCSDSSAWPWLTVIDLNRQTLEWKSVGCFDQSQNSALQSYLSGMTKSDLLLASTGPGQALGSLNLAPIGGTDFTQAHAQSAYSYSIIGYGQAGAGLATESYTTNSGAAWPGISGDLVHFGSGSAQMFGFQSTDPVGFAVVNQDGSPSIVIGNVTNFNFGPGVTSVNQETPAGFGSVTYNPPSTFGDGGGLWVLVLDRHSLNVVTSNAFSSTNYDNTPNTYQVGDLYALLSQYTNNSDLIFITTIKGIIPIYSNSNASYSQVLNFIQLTGVSPHAFDKAMQWQTSLGTEAGTFSMVGIPNEFTVEVPLKGASPCASIPNNSTLTCGPNTHQWFSSTIDTQQGETGSLQGSLVRDKSFQYAPTSVQPIDVTQLANQNPDSLLASNLSLAIGSAPSVPWPMMDTTAHKAAYAWLSAWLTSQSFHGGSTCGTAPSCSDIRSYYTGIELPDITGEKDAFNALPYPAKSPNLDFDQASWNDVHTQLAAEIQALENVQNFQTYLGNINGQNDLTLAVNLSQAASDVANELNEAMGQPTSSAISTQLSISEDALDAASAFASASGKFFPPAAVFSGILKGVSELLTLANDANANTAPDPYVNQLSNLTMTTSDAASATATKFASDLSTNTNTFFNNVYQDWFKLQTIGLLAVNNDPNNSWYLQSVDSDTMMPTLLASARRDFYIQIARQYFVTTYVTNATYVQGSNWQNSWPNLTNFDTFVAESANVNQQEGLQLTHLGNYSWDIRDPLAGSDGNWTYNFIVLKNNQSATWPSSFGNALMGPANSTDGLGNLNLNRDMLYDSGIFPQTSTENFPTWWSDYEAAESCAQSPTCSAPWGNY